jgi:hypothetical protein
MAVEPSHCARDERLHDSDPEDKAAELIASLTAEDADRLWSVIIQLKPHLRD